MKKNMGNLDRILRFMVAAVLVWLFYTGTISGIWGILLVVLAVVFFLTSLMGFCPLYRPFGIRTCNMKEQ
ncbi:DUF2892 domain-containing protein [Arenibacter aquaticus]|uniref:DUF2892 domain-containing protein n=1 Tax=Arenibacter aquaticus TaxID=2489054 RepID=A0A3S0C573_9FLAO|nr:DUF2892 domain-containing protein [Arenibacter aquaticus]RTE52388.1 DUF2892 domain-containing protein [Arenibacter aquaticus]